MPGSALRFPELLPDVPGEILIRRHIFGGQILSKQLWDLEDNTVKISNQLFLRFSGELCHVWQIHLRLFRDGYRQRFNSRVHMLHGVLLANGAFGEHVRLALQIAVVIQDFQ